VASELPSLGERKVIVNLPEFEPDVLLPVCEVLCQEGFTTWSLSADRVGQLAELRASFGRRARIGVHGVTDSRQVQKAAEVGAAFAAADFMAPKLPKVVAGFPVILGGLTPTELRAGLAAGAAAVQVVPAESLGSDYARALPGLLGYPPLIAAGRMKRGLAALWLESGAVGVWPPELFADELAMAAGLDGLRTELQLWHLED